MKISSKSPAGATGVGGADPSQDIQQQLDQLEQYLQMIAQQQQTGVQQMDPQQLSNGIQSGLRSLQRPMESGQLSPEQNERLQKVVDAVGALIQGQGVPQNSQTVATGHSTEDKYDQKKVGGHHGGHHHVHSAPPVDQSDPDASTIQANPTDSPD
jgi:hypothetical protein